MPFQIRNNGSAQYKAHNEWARRPDDERFLSLDDMLSHFRKIREESKAVVVSSHKFGLAPKAISETETALELVGGNGHAYEPTHWAFGQLAALAGAPADYLRTLPTEMAADCLNYGLKYTRGAEDVGLLLQRNGKSTLRAATGPRYGRIWNEEVLRALVHTVGDGVSGRWTIPGIFGHKLEVITKENTTLFASDRDFFVFLADEQNKIEIPNRRDGKSGLLSRGVYLWNSETGAATFGVGCFLFDFACSNRIVWGMNEYKEFRLRHTVSAPDRFLEEIQPALVSYANSSSANVLEPIQAAQKARIDNVPEFLATRFSRNLVKPVMAIHELEEGRPIETRWDIVTGVTAYARSIQHQDTRVDLERQAGLVLAW